MASPLPADAAAEAIRRRHAGARVLLAEDDPIGQLVTLEWLDGLALQADLATDGYEAVDMATRTPYALVLLDYHMPRLDGPATAGALRRLPMQARTPVVVLTARPLSSEDRQACRQAGIDDFLAKPIEGPALAACLLRWLDQGQGGAAAPAKPGAGAATAPAAAAAAPGPDLQAMHPLLRLPGLDAVAGLAAVGGKPEVYCRLLRVFAQTHGGEGREVQRQLQLGDHAAARMLAHRLRGAAATLGLVDIDTASGALEGAIDRGDVAPAVLQPLTDDLIQALEQGLQRLRAALPAANG
ncbi:MAG: response regulator [Proteobacteria bacterium]|nr:response regulator [Pseudomonadota bacterium]